MERHPNQAYSASDTDPSEAGAARTDGSVSAAERIKRDAKDFIRLGRSITEDYRAGRLTFEEYGLLIQLWSLANCYKAMVLISYAALADESRGKFSKNDINKLVLALKKKHFIWFKRSPGRRGPIEVYINYYPLAEGGYTSLDGFFASATSVRSIEEIIEKIEVSKEVADAVDPEVATEADTLLQSSREQITEPTSALSAYSSPTRRRAPYNDTNEKNQKEKKKSFSFKEKPKYDATRPMPATREEERAREIADAIGEPDYRFVTAKLAQYDIDVLEQAFIEATKAFSKGGIISLGGLFNSLVEKFGEEKYGNRGETQT